MPQLFLDCDGVVADFDGYFLSVFGVPPTEVEITHGTQYLYALLQGHKDFYFNLPLLPDAMQLYSAVAHLKPIILTGHPNTSTPAWAINQKLRWTAHHFPGVQTIVCPSKEKCKHMKRFGDVLVDDRLKYMHFWTEAGGIFVWHTSAEESISRLKELDIL
jgi:hypothetical protein